MQELGTVLWSLGPNSTKAKFQKVVGELDCDGRGPVGFPELLGLMAWKVKAGDSEDHIWEAFHVFDKDSKVLVSTAKWRHTMIWLGKQLNNQEVEEMIQAVHMDADGQVNCKEFMHLLVSSEATLPAHPCPGVPSLLSPPLQALLLLWLADRSRFLPSLPFLAPAHLPTLSSFRTTQTTAKTSKAQMLSASGADAREGPWAGIRGRQSQLRVPGEGPPPRTPNWHPHQSTLIQEEGVAQALGKGR